MAHTTVLHKRPIAGTTAVAELVELQASGASSAVATVVSDSFTKTAARTVPVWEEGKAHLSPLVHSVHRLRLQYRSTDLECCLIYNN